MSTNPLTPSELHTVRAMVREQEHAAVSNGREFAGPWLIIKRLLAERDEDKTRISLKDRELDALHNELFHR